EHAAPGGEAAIRGLEPHRAAEVLGHRLGAARSRVREPHLLERHRRALDRAELTHDVRDRELVELRAEHVALGGPGDGAGGGAADYSNDGNTGAEGGSGGEPTP